MASTVAKFTIKKRACRFIYSKNNREAAAADTLMKIYTSHLHYRPDLSEIRTLQCQISGNFICLVRVRNDGGIFQSADLSEQWNFH
jgi:hypothetical protein